MADDEKPSKLGVQKPSPQQPAYMTQQECFEQEECILNYVLDQVMFYRIIWTLKH